MRVLVKFICSVTAGSNPTDFAGFAGNKPPKIAQSVRIKRTEIHRSGNKKLLARLEHGRISGVARANKTKCAALKLRGLELFSPLHWHVLQAPDAQSGIRQRFSSKKRVFYIFGFRIYISARTRPCPRIKVRNFKTFG